ncbi:MAG: hypothetical protein K9J42_03595 [Sulfuritalea sp.]|nr:hypothetical protein [Sulfuritalea sp.]
MSAGRRHLPAPRNPRCAEHTIAEFQRRVASAEFQRRITIAEFFSCIQLPEAS